MKITKLSILLIIAFAPWLKLSAQTVTNGSLSGQVDTWPISNIYNHVYYAPPGWTATGSGYSGIGQWDTATPPARGNYNPNYNVDHMDAWAPMGSSSDGGQYSVFQSEGGRWTASLFQGIAGFLPDMTYAVQFQMANMFVGRMDDGPNPFITNNDAMHAQNGHFDVSLFGTLEGTQSTLTLDYPTQTNPDYSVMGPWTNVSLTFTTNSSVTPADILELRFTHIQDPGRFLGDNPEGNFGGQLALDGVSVTQVPEPGSVALAAFAISATVLRRRRPLPL